MSMVLVGSKLLEIRATKRCTEKKMRTVTDAKTLPQRPGSCRTKNPRMIAMSAVTIDGINAPRQRESRHVALSLKIHSHSLRRQIELGFVDQEGEQQKCDADQ